VSGGGCGRLRAAIDVHGIEQHVRRDVCILRAVMCGVCIQVSSSAVQRGDSRVPTCCVDGMCDRTVALLCAIVFVTILQRALTCLTPCTRTV
jgi:hypothetical protein